MIPTRALRTILAVVVGLVLLSAVVEALEFGLVTLVNGGLTTDPPAYYGIRNRGWFLGLKLIYNTLAAGGAGYLTAWIAGYAHRGHGVALAIGQTLAFGWALSQPDLSRWTPPWMWAALIVLTAGAVTAGAAIRARQVRTP